MSDIEKASRDAVQAAQQGEQFAVLLAAVQAAQQAQPAPCQHHPAPAPQGTAGKWIAIGAAGTFLAVALAVSVVAFAIGAVALTLCVVVLRSVFNDFNDCNKAKR